MPNTPQSYDEIEKLLDDISRFDILISEPIEQLRDGLFFVKLTINNNSWTILIDDEYDDFSKDKPLVNWFLTLFSLEAYEETEDFLEWSKEFNYEPMTKLLDYYKSLSITSAEIKSILGEINPQITALDYQLRTGVVQALINYKT